MRSAKETKAEFFFFVLLFSLGMPALSGRDTLIKTPPILWGWTIEIKNAQKVKDCMLTLTPRSKSAFDDAQGKNIFSAKPIKVIMPRCLF